MSTATSPRTGRETRGVWDYVSPSRLNLWLKCPLAFRLRYIDGIPSPPSTSQFVGRVVHKALEVWYRNRLVGLTLPWQVIIDRLLQTWDESATEERVVFADRTDYDDCLKQALGLVTTYLQQVPLNEVRPLAIEAALEAPLVDPANGEDLGIPLLGIIDLILGEPQGPLITDFKTAAKGGCLPEVTHEIQLTSYSYLFRHTSPEPEGALEIRSLIKTKVPKVETHRYASRGERHFRRLFAVIRAYLDDLHSRRFVFRPGFTCSSCEFHATHCRNWAG